MPINDANKENCPPVPHKEETIHISNINEILAKCVVPTNPDIHIAAARTVEETAKDFKSTRMPGMWDEYCLAPSFGLIDQ